MKSNETPEGITKTQKLVIKFFEPKLNLKLFSKINEEEIDSRIRTYVIHRNGDKLHDKEILISGKIDETISDVLTKEEQEKEYEEYLENREKEMQIEMSEAGINLPYDDFEREAIEEEFGETFISDEDVENFNNYLQQFRESNMISLYWLIVSKIYQDLENNAPFKEDIVEETMKIYTSKIYQGLPDAPDGTPMGDSTFLESLSSGFGNYLFSYLYEMIINNPPFLFKNFFKDIAKYNFQKGFLYSPNFLSHDEMSIIFDYLQILHHR